MGFTLRIEGRNLPTRLLTSPCQDTQGEAEFRRAAGPFAMDRLNDWAMARRRLVSVRPRLRSETVAGLSIRDGCSQ